MTLALRIITESKSRPLHVKIFLHMITKAKLFNPDFFEDIKQIIHDLISRYYTVMLYTIYIIQV